MSVIIINKPTLWLDAYIDAYIHLKSFPSAYSSLCVVSSSAETEYLFIARM